MAITNTKVFPKNFDRDVTRIFFDELIPYVRDFPDVAVVTTRSKPGSHLTEAEMSGIGHLQDLPEGNQVTFDIPVEGHEKTIYWDWYALGIQITERMMTYDFRGNFKKLPQKLAKSAAIKPDVIFHNNIFNNGFTGTDKYNLSWDGQNIFDQDHTQLYTGLSNIANEPSTAGALSETTLQAGFEYFWGVNDEAGMPVTLTPDLLYVAPANAWQLSKLKKSGLIIGSMDNDPNTVMPGFTEGPGGQTVGWRGKVSRFLTSDDAWFLLAKERDCRLDWVLQARFDSSDDFHTGSALFKVTEAFQAYAMSYREMYGNPGT